MNSVVSHSGQALDHVATDTGTEIVSLMIEIGRFYHQCLPLPTPPRHAEPLTNMFGQLRMVADRYNPHVMDLLLKYNDITWRL